MRRVKGQGLLFLLSPIFHCHKSKMATTTILRTRTRFRPPKIRLRSLKRGTVFSLISGQRIVSQLCLCRFYQVSSKQLIEETPFVGLFKLVHPYGGEFKISRILF